MNSAPLRRTVFALIGSLALIAQSVAAADAGQVLTRRPTAVLGMARATAQASAGEARRVDRVPTPKITWSPCMEGMQCASVRLPLDYDQPTGATVRLALVRARATDPSRRIGTLFVNPGGPGAPATSFVPEFAMAAGDEVRARFDIVGFDPRGIGSSDQVRCFSSTDAQRQALAGLDVPFPMGAHQTQAYQASAARLAAGCATTGGDLARSMSTAQVARDMDVLRRAVGDRQLTYLGFSYGTHLGATYATLFPERVRAMALDGVVDPAAWAGNHLDRLTPVSLRLRAAEGANETLRSGLAACDKAGVDKCPLAGSALARWQKVGSALQAAPLSFETPDGPMLLTYAQWVSDTQQALYGAGGLEYVVASTLDVEKALATRGVRAQSGTDRRTSAALQRFSKRRATWQRSLAPTGGLVATGQVRAASSYDNSLDSYATVMCSDSLNPSSAQAWPAAIARVPGPFNTTWGWSSPWCARDSWRAVDEDAFRGPWGARTPRPVLVVGGRHDPATNHHGAVLAARRLGNSRLVTSDHYGHTAYLTSACITNAIDAQLLYSRVPAAGLVCRGEVQPFTQPWVDIDRLMLTDPIAYSRGAPASLRRSGLRPAVPR